jgi:phospholipid transport system substrate-binding protein
MKIKAIFLSFFLVCSFLYAISEENIKTQTTQKMEEVTKTLQNKEMSTEDKSQKIFDLFDNFFDFERMSSLSLGKAQWTSLTEQQQQEFNEKFVQKIRQSFVDKLSLYDDQKISVLDIVKSSNSRIQLPMTLTDNAGKKYEILYKFYNTKNSDDWLIYDVDILGVSIVQTYRSQFDGMLQKYSFQEMMEKIDSLQIDTNSTE